MGVSVVRIRRYPGPFLAVWGLVLFCSCAATHQNKEVFYSVPPVTYLRECPDFDCPPVGELYNSDQVKLLAEADHGWWQVQVQRDQKVGWTRRDLLSETPIQAETYYISAEGVPLRATPNKEVISRTRLAYGDKVQKIGEQGSWWRVLAEKDKSLGWIPAETAVAEPPEKLGIKPAPYDDSKKPGKTSSGKASSKSPPSPQVFYVAADVVNLHLIPFAGSQVVKVLGVNNKVEKISEAGSWVKVRYPDTGAEGWVWGRYLRDSPVTDKTQIITRKKKPARKTRIPGQPSPDPFASETLEPEGM